MSRPRLKNAARYIRALKQISCVVMIALYPHQVWRSWVHAPWEPLGKSVPHPTIAQRKHTSSITQPRSEQLEKVRVRPLPHRHRVVSLTPFRTDLTDFMTISWLNCSSVFILFCSFHVFCLIRVICFYQLLNSRPSFTYFSYHQDFTLQPIEWLTVVTWRFKTNGGSGRCVYCLIILILRSL